MRNALRTLPILLLLLGLEAAALYGQTAGNASGGSTILWSPPRIGWPDELPPSTVPQEMIGTLHVADMRIILEDTALENAQKHFGGPIGSRGDAGEAEGWLCLHGSDSNGPWIFWLTSGEIDGPAIDGFQWRRLSAGEAPDRRCHTLPLGNSRIELPIPIRLGTSETEARRTLGRPTFARGKLLIFCHEHQTIIDRENYTVSNNIAVVLRDGVVWAIQVAKSTSN